MTDQLELDAMTAATNAFESEFAACIAAGLDEETAREWAEDAAGNAYDDFISENLHDY